MVGRNESHWLIFSGWFAGKYAISCEDGITMYGTAKGSLTQWTIPLKDATILLKNFYRDPLQPSLCCLLMFEPKIIRWFLLSLKSPQFHVETQVLSNIDIVKVLNVWARRES